MSFSTGVFIGMSPFLGIHTILGVIVAWLFRLNTFAIITGVYITNPWTIVPIYTFSTWVGVQCLGLQQIIPKIDWSTITFSKFLNELTPLLMPFIGPIVTPWSIGTMTALLVFLLKILSILIDFPCKGLPQLMYK